MSQASSTPPDRKALDGKASALGQDTQGLSLAELARSLLDLDPEISGAPETRIEAVRQDSRQVEPGDLFVARPGSRSAGTQFVQQAIDRGARAILTQNDSEVLPGLSVPVIRVRDARLGLALASEAVCGFPSRRLKLFGVTGTNGKTTVSYLVEQALALLGARPARLGTLGFSFQGQSEEGAFTTPEADSISRCLARAVAGGATHFVMEVSSHALAQARVAALRFDTVAFTNLTQDHLDFHASMREYGAAKARLFTDFSPRTSVIHVDDAFGKELVELAVSPVLSVSRRQTAGLFARRVELGARGVRAELEHAGMRCYLESRLVGAHNLENLLVALGMLLADGYPLASAAQALAQANPAPGRLERCDTPADELLTVVDYAHTPDALARVLEALRPLSAGKLWCVFGCGGDRDPNKRPRMGEAVARAADHAIITNDNPRTEDPARIAAAVVEGFEQLETGARVATRQIELDRARAIELAVSGAAPGDVVLIAGKGHEDYQIFGTDKRHFDDREEARRALDRRRERRMKGGQSA